MIEKIYFRNFISVAQKSTASSAQYGEGYNYWVETGVKTPLRGDESLVQRKIKETVGRLDHKALGTDVDLGFDPTSVRLCEWLFEEIKRACAPEEVMEVRMLRGDGYQVIKT